MYELHYSRARLFVLLVGAVAMVALGVWAWVTQEGKASFLGGMIAAFFVVCTPMIVLKFFGDRTALRADRRGLYVATLWRSRLVSWDEVESIGSEQLEVGRVMTSEIDYLTIETTSGTTLRVTSGLLVGGKAALASVTDGILAAMEAPITRRQPVRETPTEAPITPQRPTFGRRAA